ncbi:hypothetical protein B0H16DRAFT_1709763 [Mycena metata]|uniref:DUF4100 domain-containing protein n=1 Tax=Mycena metata TaxID=1033252 RepID=A0AAD7KCJ4_9AGAR|nr:hypothetical protein B0H16DRAFT_1709763 [Mycena metata]
MATTNTSILRIPMPIPGTVNTPYFNGKYLSDFLLILVQHGSNAGIQDLDDLVPYIVQYSSDEVKDIIRYTPEFDTNNKKTFDQAKNYTEEMLREFCREHNAKSLFKNKVQIETYLKDFMKLARPLVKQTKITNKQRDYYFVASLPSTIKEWFNSQVPSAKRKRSGPPTIAESITILQKHFDSDSLLFEPWKAETETENRKVKFDTDGRRIELSTRQNTRPPSPVNTQNAPTTTVNDVKDLTKLLKVEELKVQEVLGLSKILVAFPVVVSCPQTKLLLESGLIKFDTICGHYTMPDGNDLPRAPPAFIGGLADYIRAQIWDQNQAQNTARTSTMRLSYGNEGVLKGDVKTPIDMTCSADPTTRDLTDMKILFQKILKFKINVPLFQLIGASPQLQKLLSDATHVRREYSTKSAEYSFHDSEDFEADEY